MQDTEIRGALGLSRAVRARPCYLQPALANAASTIACVPRENSSGQG